MRESRRAVVATDDDERVVEFAYLFEALDVYSERVIECIQRHVKLGCSSFVIEFFGRDTKEPAALFAETVLKELRR